MNNLDTFWTTMHERQCIFNRRVEGQPGPWTIDPVFQTYKFTNVYRILDRNTQYLLTRVIGTGEHEDDVFRLLLFKMFNRTDTWDWLEANLGPITWASFRVHRYRDALDSRKRESALYTGAYMMPSRGSGYDSSTMHHNHLNLVRCMMDEGLPRRIVQCMNLSAAFLTLRSYSMIGPFLAYQLAMDLNYLPTVNLPEDGFTVPGPGAKAGLKLCFGDRPINAALIEHLRLNQYRAFSTRGLDFPFWQRRELRLADIEHWLCETAKYIRVRDGGTAPRSRFTPHPKPLSTFVNPEEH